jgi:hypothetical protein
MPDLAVQIEEVLACILLQPLLGPHSGSQRILAMAAHSRQGRVAFPIQLDANQQGKGLVPRCPYRCAVVGPAQHVLTQGLVARTLRQNNLCNCTNGRRRFLPARAERSTSRTGRCHAHESHARRWLDDRINDIWLAVITREARIG